MRVEKIQPPSCSGFDKLPLPCAKKLWLAQTTLEWEDEYKKYLSFRYRGEMLTAGSLREAFGGASIDHESDLAKDLSNWSKDVDDLGSLLLLII